MADQNSAFEKFLSKLAQPSTAVSEVPLQRVVHITTVGSSEPTEWTYRNHDAFGILVSPPGDYLDRYSFIPWATITRIE